MTGYGRGEIEREGVRVTAELRTFNNRFLELTPKIPRFLAPLENDIKRVIHKQVSRGRVLVNINWEDAGGLAETISLDEEVADRYYGLLRAVKERYNLPGDIDLPAFTVLPDLLKRDVAELEPGQALPLVEEALEIALEELLVMKSKEGSALAQDLAERIDRTLTYLGKIQSRIPRRIEEVRQKLATRLAEITEQTECSEALLAQEIVLFTDRSDCTEECVRYQVHCDNFKSYLAEGGAVGRKLNFLLQEMARETNTMGVKASDADVSTDVVLIKEELERIREQVQNIE
jgi:uncharacterized protein (TIGR00255 family)